MLWEPTAEGKQGSLSLAKCFLNWDLTAEQGITVGRAVGGSRQREEVSIWDEAASLKAPRRSISCSRVRGRPERL